MSDTWAGLLAISVAVMALIQVVVMIGLAIAAKRMMAVADSARLRVEALSGDVQQKVNDIHTKLDHVLGDVRHATTSAQQMVTDARDRMTRMEEAVRAAGQKVVTAVENVPTPVKRGVPAAVAVLAAYRTIRNIRQRMRERDRVDDMFVAS
jgi:uncharacterized protein YoxC